MKNILIFDDELLQSFKRELKPSVVSNNDKGFSVSMRFGFNIIDGTRKEKRLFTYMFNRKRRIQKKWNKKYNDKFKIINVNPMIAAGMAIA